MAAGTSSVAPVAGLAAAALALTAWPSKLDLGELEADWNEVAVEAITLSHEGFEIR